MAGREFTMIRFGNGRWENPGTIRAEYVEERRETPFSVPDDFWVLEVFSWYNIQDGNGKYFQVVGPKPKDVRLQRLIGGDHHLLIGYDPFGALISEQNWGRMEEGRRLMLARQIHKGELGRYPEVPKLNVTYDEKRNKNHAGKHRNGWVRLTELARVSGLSIEQILTNYWPVIDYGAGQPRRIGPEAQIEILMAHTPEQIVYGGATAPLWLSRDEISRWLAMGQERDWADVWIRKGVAKTILHLVQFGHDFAPTNVPA